MPLPKNSLLRWINTLKFKIVAIAVVTGVVSAMGTTQIVLGKTQAEIERLLLRNDTDDSERTAALLANKLDMLQLALGAVARQATAEKWQDAESMTRYLVDKPATVALFDSVFAAAADGRMLARVEKENARAVTVNIADREYFQRALKTDQPVISRAIVGKVNKLPIIVIAIPVLAADGQVTGVIGGSLQLRSSSLFSNLGGTTRADSSRTLVMDRSGLLLAHGDAARVMANAADEPGLADVFARWHDSGSPIETHGASLLSGGHLVSLAGIPASDWVLVRLTPQALALAPLAAAQRTAWQAAAGVGLVAALLAGVLGWAMTRPISRLRSRAEKLLHDTGPSTEGWPRQNGEVGELARAFQHVIEQRQQRQSETQAMLHQIEAVLDHAEIGIALTRNGQFELVSRQFCHIFRCEKHQVVGQTTRLIHASDEAYQALSDRARPAFMAHGAFDGELELMRRSGQTFWAHMRGRAVVAGDRSQGTIWIIEDVTEVREQRERLAWTSSHDSLTGLANRAAFEVLLEHATSRAEKEPFCALFIDLDRFKLVNDTGGHAAGDALLRDVANELAAQVRKSDTVARLGGDEFAVLLSHCPLAQAAAIAEKLRSAVVAYQLPWEGHVFGVGASIGLVPVDASYATATDVLRAADAACYAAKRQGRNCVAVHGGAPAPQTAEPVASADPANIGSI
ncbi:MAG: diguanylate cyclase [Burkholderiales bacterium]|nr:diguanylate cyclase [Burkholderiales bacterium]